MTRYGDWVTAIGVSVLKSTISDTVSGQVGNSVIDRKALQNSRQVGLERS